MKAHALVPADVGAERLVGLVLCHDVHDAAGRPAFRKGQLLDAAAANRLAGVARVEVHLLEMEPEDIHEDPAGERLARVVAGPGVCVRDSVGGQWVLAAEHRGLLGVDVEGLAAVNALEGISVYTLYDAQVVDAGEVVAKVKVTPLVISDAVLREAERRCSRSRGPVVVGTFRPLAVAAVAAGSLESRARARFEGTLREKLAWFGASLRHLAFPDAGADDLARALAACRDTGADILVVAGANALDPLDPVFFALERLGARMVRRGVPAHPGSLLWLAELGEVSVLGLPSCGMFSRATLFDLVLPRLLAGQPVGRAELAALGHGGLLGHEMAFRFPPYRAGHDRGALPG